MLESYDVIQVIMDCERLQGQSASTYVPLFHCVNPGIHNDLTYLVLII